MTKWTKFRMALWQVCILIKGQHERNFVWHFSKFACCTFIVLATTTTNKLSFFTKQTKETELFWFLLLLFPYSVTIAMIIKEYKEEAMFACCDVVLDSFSNVYGLSEKFLGKITGSEREIRSSIPSDPTFFHIFLW